MKKFSSSKAMCVAVAATLALASGAAAELLYAQSFINPGTPDLSLTNYNWTSVMESTDGVAVNPTYTGNRIEGVAQGDYGFLAPRLTGGAAYRGSNTLFYTTAVPNLTVAGLEELSVDQRNDETGSVIRFTIQIGSQWYASAIDYGGRNSDWATKEMTSFSLASNWNELTVTTGGTGEITLGSNPASALSGTIAAYGFFANAGSIGDHLRFDNFEVNGVALDILPATILSITPVGDDVMKIVVDAPSAGKNYWPQARQNLITGSWEGVAHSVDGSAPWHVTNLTYVTEFESTTNEVIYVQATNAVSFFGIGE